MRNNGKFFGVEGDFSSPFTAASSISRAMNRSWLSAGGDVNIHLHLGGFYDEINQRALSSIVNNLIDFFSVDDFYFILLDLSKFVKVQGGKPEAQYQEVSKVLNDAILSADHRPVLLITYGACSNSSVIFDFINTDYDVDLPLCCIVEPSFRVAHGASYHLLEKLSFSSYIAKIQKNTKFYFDKYLITNDNAFCKFCVFYDSILPKDDSSLVILCSKKGATINFKNINKLSYGFYF